MMSLIPSGVCMLIFYSLSTKYTIKTSNNNSYPFKYFYIDTGSKVIRDRRSNKRFEHIKYINEIIPILDYNKIYSSDIKDFYSDIVLIPQNMKLVSILTSYIQEKYKLTLQYIHKNTIIKDIVNVINRNFIETPLKITHLLQGVRVHIDYKLKIQTQVDMDKQ